MCEELVESMDRGILEEEPDLRDRYLALIARQQADTGNIYGVVSEVCSRHG